MKTEMMMMMTALCATALYADVAPAPVIKPVPTVPATAKMVAPAPVVAPAPTVSSAATAQPSSDYESAPLCNFYSIRVDRTNTGDRALNFFNTIIDDPGNFTAVHTAYDTQKRFGFNTAPNGGTTYNLVSWTGAFKVKESGQYTFILQTPFGRNLFFFYGAALSVNGEKVVTRDNQATLDVELKAGYNDITVFFAPPPRYSKPQGVVVSYKKRNKPKAPTQIGPASLFHKVQD